MSSRACHWIGVTVFGAVVFLVPVWEILGDVWPGRGLADAWNLKDVTRGRFAVKVEDELMQSSVAAAAVRPYYNEAMLTGFGEVASTVTRGEGRWLFQRSTVRGYPSPQAWNTLPESVGYMRGLHAWLAERGCRLLILLVPNKATLFPEKLARIRPRLRVVYDEVFTALSAPGDGPAGQGDLWMVDPRPVLAKEGDTPSYVPTDTHWTPRAAREVAGLVAAEIRGRLDEVPGRPVDAHFVEEPARMYLGDLVYSLGLRRGGALENTYLLPVEVLRAEAVDGGAVVTTEPEAIALAGTSFSHVYGLASMLAGHLGRSVEDRAQAGKGPTASLMAIIEEVAAGERPAPEVLVWEFPERYLFLTYARLQEPLRNFLASQSYDATRAEALPAARRTLVDLTLLDGEGGVLDGTPSSKDPAIVYELSRPLPADGSMALVFRVTASRPTAAMVYLDRGDGFPDRADTIVVIPKRGQEQLVVAPVQSEEGGTVVRVRVEPVKGRKPFRMTPVEVWPR